MFHVSDEKIKLVT